MPQPVTFVILHRSSESLPRSKNEATSNSNYWLLIQEFYHNSLAPFVGMIGAVCGNDSSLYLMHLRSRLISRPRTLIPLDNRAHSMANTSPTLDLVGLHREMQGIVEQIMIMNENNAHLIQHLATNNPPPPSAPIPKLVDLAVLIN